MGAIVDEPGDQFPIGMRVLAVDDNPTCLRILEFLLKTCHYQVRTANRAVTALNMLRENKFDMVISDVHMPDMDGFKFLELMGLEMDLPVIMLSANGDPKLVMKGIDHGACDYMLKPIRIEELKIIWQHVIRKRKQAPKDRNNSGNQERPENGGGDGPSVGNFDAGESSYRKRKDQNDNEVEENNDGNGVENEDPSAPKKPRVVWTVDLHRDFVLAVNQLGVDKAVPKRILELMNVEYLTREHVASHLQKYRIYLRRLKEDINQLPNMDPRVNIDPSNYPLVDSMNGFQNYYAIPGPGQFQNPMFNTYPPRGMLGQPNTPIGLGMHGSGVGHMGHAQTSNSSANNLAMFQAGVFPGNHNGGMLQATPLSLELEALYGNSNSIGGLSNAINDMTLFPVHSPGPHSNSFPGSNYFQQAALHTSSLSDRPSTMTLPIGSNLSGAFSTPTQMQYQRTDLHGLAPSNSTNAGQMIDNAPFQPNYSTVTHVNGASGSSGPSLDHQNINFSGNMDYNLIRQLSFVQHSELDTSGVETAMQLHDGYLMDQQRQQGSFVANSFSSLEDLETAMMSEDEDNVKPNAYFESGSYPP